ncbi:MAG: Mrp/NBP35 family ATP-binding protein [Planctomycetes bacterium]|nr:Mrp/NBP35 family ATP-binding protein [Planctomycetota bacterium]
MAGPPQQPHVPPAHVPPTLAPSLTGVKRIVAVGAGKGGVGKSTFAALLAVGLSRQGASVGLLDADVYGPSIPTLMGVAGQHPQVDDAKKQMIPVDANGVKVISVGFMIDPNEAVVWRGPMVHGLLKQFLEQVEWGQLDYLIVDLPPGTGDVALTLAQTIPMTGAVVVCTPQDLALQDARRALKMYETLNVPTLGIVENMSYYLCPKCGNRDEIFDSGGAEEAARALGIPFLGALPLNASVRASADSGRLADNFVAGSNDSVGSNDKVAASLDGIVASFTKAVESSQANSEGAPTLTIE